ncbi:MAG: hypothetical protein AAF676_02020 [Pseudomonadota bacterium]
MEAFEAACDRRPVEPCERWAARGIAASTSCVSRPCFRGSGHAGKTRGAFEQDSMDVLSGRCAAWHAQLDLDPDRLIRAPFSRMQAFACRAGEETCSAIDRAAAMDGGGSARGGAWPSCTAAA